MASSLYTKRIVYTASSLPRAFSTCLSRSSHSNPLVCIPCWPSPPSRAPSELTVASLSVRSGSADESTCSSDDASHGRGSSEEVCHPRGQEGCRRRERQGRRGEEHRRRSVTRTSSSDRDAQLTSILGPVNLALALLLEQPTKRVGLLDLDVFGPSVPRLMGLDHLGEPELTPRQHSLSAECHPPHYAQELTLFLGCVTGGRLIPLDNHGISTMSMGYLVRESVSAVCAGQRRSADAHSTALILAAQSATGENPIVWRGMMVMKAVQQVSRNHRLRP
jgi:hypothetical protein